MSAIFTTTSYLEPQDPEFAARRREALSRAYAASQRRRRSAPSAPYTHVRVVRGGLPSLGRRK